jgi:hypothetical protein
MSARTKLQPADAFRYEQEDLVPRDESAEIAELERLLERNKDKVAASLAQARAEFDRGEYFTLDQVIADVDAQRQRRRASKA